MEIYNEKNTAVFTTEDLVKELVQNRENAVVTGAAGTGKSFIIEKLKEIYDETELLLCAPTGYSSKKY